MPMLTHSKEGKIFEAIPKIIGDIQPVGKDRKNQQQGYAFRSIDDVYPVLQPLLAKYGVTIVPCVLSCEESQQTTSHNKIMWRVTMLVRYRLFAIDGSYIASVVRAEAMDTSDKASYKAMSMALKYLVFQVFFPPIKDSGGDVENDSHEAAPAPPPDPAKLKAAKVESLKKYYKDSLTTVEHYLAEGMVNKEDQPIKWLEKGQTLSDLTEERLNWCCDNKKKLKDKAEVWLKMETEGKE
jgi:hypothetical protein